MTQRKFLPTLRFLRPRPRDQQCGEETISSWVDIQCGKREWEDFYRRRWQFDKVVRSTHGVNCTGSCSWNVYVKDGIITWETQRVDYPGTGPEMPDYEPRGCPRGATFSWYVYSPVRVKFPYVRSALIEMWRDALKRNPDPVSAWAELSGNREATRKYKKARGKGGFVRVSWDEALTLVCASLVHTVKRYGPDRIFGFSPIPAMSMVCYISGARFLSLIGASMISFYDWYCDLPPASPQVWGEQTDVPVSGDWYDATYMIVWGTNIPMTRSPDAHFYTEARYRGARVTAVAPDYAEYVRFADTWLPARAGTDAALALAMVHVIVKEFYIERPCGYFLDYAVKYTDLPFAVMLRGKGENHCADRFLRASDLGLEVEKGEWKPVVFDRFGKGFVAPNGSIGSRWEEKGQWNLNLEDSVSGSGIDPVLSFGEANDEWVQVEFPVFDAAGPGAKTGAVPVKKVLAGGAEIYVTTVFDLLCAHLGVDRGHGGAKDYDDPSLYTPAWQEAVTGAPKEDVVRVAREFAENAAKTRGKSMIFLGAGTNHWYHSDTIYRAIIGLTTLCGCQGVNGGGWAHYVGQEKVRPLAGFTALAFGLDWLRPPRQQNGTSYYYFATDQWRYEKLDPKEFSSPVFPWDGPISIADSNIQAARLGWLPSYPQFDRNPLDLCREAVQNGAESDDEIISQVAEKLRSGALKFAIEDPCNPENIPRVLFLWRANLLGASGKGHEYFLKHLLGVDNAVMGEEIAEGRPEEMVYRESDPDGKLDLLVTTEMRMSTSALYADVLLPAAGWYEMHDLSTTDLHPFIHPFNPAIDPPWETRTNWDQFKAMAEKFSELAAPHLGKEKDIVATPLLHDTPGEIAQPYGRVMDWKKSEVEAVPGRTMPNLQVVERDYPNIDRMMTSVGPLIVSKGMGAKGVAWKASEEYEELKHRLGTVSTEGVGKGFPSMKTGRQVAEAILALAPETSGRTAMKAWTDIERKTGLSGLAAEFCPETGQEYSFQKLTVQPSKVLTTPIWSGMETESRSYSPFVINIEKKIPFRTLTGRAQFYQDHRWMLAFGEGLPVYRPPIETHALDSRRLDQVREPGKEIILRYLTPHSKWSIHSTYSDTKIMLTLFRGGEAIWINDEDAESIGIRDNDWLECFNENGVLVAKAVVSHRIPPGAAFCYHAQERLINVPGSSISRQRGGTHNSVTSIMMKPTQMIGGYAQLSYGFNYYGPTGAQRDEVILVRKAGEVDWYED